MSNFETAILTVLKHEGGFVNDPKDAGGATSYGISLRFLQGVANGDLNRDGQVDADDIAQLTREDAIEIYRAEWWERYRYDKIIDQGVATKTFDLAVNMGNSQAHRCLQRAVRAVTSIRLNEDGILGTKTFEAINAALASSLLIALRSEAAGVYRSLNQPRYLEGWLNRAYA